MRIDKLHQGQVFKNYKLMCQELEMPIRTSNAKKAQRKELERFCRIQQVGHSLTVVELYDFPLDRTETRGKTSIYGDLMQLLITDHLISTNKQTVLVTRSNMLKNIEMVNENYSYGSRNVPQLSKYMNINQQTIYDFYNTSGSNFKSAFETALKNLRSKALIIYDIVTVICTSQMEHVVATNIEKETILSFEKRVLDELGFDDIGSVRISAKWNNFKDSLSKILKEESNIMYYYSSYRITVNKEYIQNSHENMLKEITTELERREKKDELNILVCERLIENAKKRREKTGEGKMKIVRSSFNYVQQNQTLVNLLIDSDAKSIVKTIEDIKEKEGKRG